MRDPGPGPKYGLPTTVGAYGHDPTRERAPGYSFGTRYAYHTHPSPGPYYIEGGINNRGRLNNSGFTLAGRPKHSMWGGQEDGPKISYDVNRSFTEPCSPRYTFGQSRSVNYKTNSPGPIYDIPSTIGRGLAASIYGRDDRMSFYYDHSKSPGPSYNTAFKPGPAYSIGQRTQLPGNKLITPGPDTYYPPPNGTSTRSPRFSMGVRHHAEIITMADVSD